MDYGKGIAKAREALGVSKRKLAGLAGLHPSYITHIESARKKPSLDALEAIARAIGIPMPLLVLLSAEAHELNGVAHEFRGELESALLSLSAPVGPND